MKHLTSILSALILAAGSLPGQELATTAPTPTVTGTGNSATVAWSFVRGATGYTLMRRIMSREPDGRILATQDWRAVGSTTATSLVDVLPKPSTIYEYRVDGATRMAGSVVSSTAVQYTSPAFTTPTNLAAKGSGAQVNLTWTPAMAGVVGYLAIRYQLDGKGMETRTQLTPSPIAAATFTDVIQNFAVMYNYEVLSVDATGATVTSGRVKYIPPPMPPVVAVVGTGNQAMLSWTPTNGAMFYDVMREVLDASGQVIAKSDFAARNLQATTSFTDVLQGPGVRLRYTVVARGYDGNPIISSNGVTFVAADYMTPVGLIMAGGGGKVSLSWRAASGVAFYQVNRRTVNPDGSTGGISMRNKQLSGTDYVDDVPTPGLLYEYQVVGVGPDGRLYPGSWVRFAAGSW